MNDHERIELLRSVDLKLQHARRKAEELSRSIRDWSAATPIRPRSELREGRLGFRLVLDDFNQPDAIDDWRLLAGEWAHSLRSSLDVLAFALARLHADPPGRPQDVKFPICERREDFNRAGRKAISQVPPSAARLIEAIQPFQRTGAGDSTPDRDPLLALQELNNFDKHRLLVDVRLAPTEIAHTGEIKFASEREAESNVPPDCTIWTGPLGPGVILLEHRTTCPIVSATGNIGFQAIVTIAVGKGHADLLRLVEDRNRYVAEVVARFRPFFGGLRAQ